MAASEVQSRFCPVQLQLRLSMGRSVGSERRAVEGGVSMPCWLPGVTTGGQKSSHTTPWVTRDWRKATFLPFLGIEKKGMLVSSMQMVDWLVSPESGMCPVLKDFPGISLVPRCPRRCKPEGPRMENETGLGLSAPTSGQSLLCFAQAHLSHLCLYRPPSYLPIETLS